MLKIPSSWLQILKPEIKKEYYKNILNFLESEKKAWKTIYPEEKNIFNALKLTNFENIKIIILGQDPYHWKSEAHWLSFSVADWIKIPPSLRNIFKELWKLDEENWNLENWAKQWVLLLNTVLTVEKDKANSHKNIWWEIFTDNIISKISDKKENIVFLLWWNQAKQKAKLIDLNKHLVLETSHPSPLWSYRWFLWSKCFIECNKYLEKNWKKKINW